MDEDEDMSEKADKRAFRELRKMDNSLSSDIRMKEDTPSENGDGKLPILDTKMWVESEGEIEQVRYELYEKPMVSRVVTMERSSPISGGGPVEKEHVER